MGVPSLFGEGQALYSLTYQNTAMKTLFTLHNILIRDTLKVLLWDSMFVCSRILGGSRGTLSKCVCKDVN